MVLDQQVPSQSQLYYPGYYYPADYYSNYLPSLWARHYQDIASSWQNFNEKNYNAPIPGLNLPQPLNLPQVPPFSQLPFNSMQTQPQDQQLQNNIFQNQNITQSDQQFQQHFQQLLNQQHQYAQQQQQQQMLSYNQQGFSNDPEEKVKRDLYNEFFDLDNNSIKKEDNILLPNAVTAALNSNRSRSSHKKDEDGSETDSVSSSDSSNACSESSSNAVVDNIINSGLENSVIKRSSMKIPSKNDGELSPKGSEEGDKVYHCEFCNKKFTRSWNYQRHVLIHSGRKPHKCEVCQKAFVLAAHLKIHMRIHTG